MTDYRCRVSEEELAHDHAQVEITSEREWEDAQSRREQFKELLDELTTDTDFMLKRPNWSPDEDDIETLLTIQEELYWYALATKNKERVKK